MLDGYDHEAGRLARKPHDSVRLRTIVKHIEWEPGGVRSGRRAAKQVARHLGVSE